ncbi:MAG: hypothetical protein Q8P36_00305 [bacterium]|nr:hypothetical protein [bacterium]
MTKIALPSQDEYRRGIMKRATYISALTLALALPGSVLAAPHNELVPAMAKAGRSVVIATSSPGNTYALGASVILAAPVSKDLSALGGTVVVASPITGDALLIGGSVETRAPIVGDMRVISGSANIEKPVGGDLAALVFSLKGVGKVKGNVLVAALNATLTGGADGPVTIYGNTITLGGGYKGDVRVVAGDHLTLLPGTTIHGSLVYQAPVPAAIPDSASVLGGITYTEASYLPGANVSRVLAFASIGIFLLARVLALLILAGLLTGLFPRFADAVIDEAYEGRMRHILLLMLLGFATFVATPILLLLLTLTFIGLGLAILLFILYVLLVLLSLVYAGVLVGGLFARRFLHRERVGWSDGVLGTFVLSIVALVPVLGLLLVVLLASFAAGALLAIFFRFALGYVEEEAML